MAWIYPVFRGLKLGYAEDVPARLCSKMVEEIGEGVHEGQKVSA